jgi:hypothetical protein
MNFLVGSGDPYGLSRQNHLRHRIDRIKADPAPIRQITVQRY